MKSPKTNSKKEKTIDVRHSQVVSAKKKSLKKASVIVISVIAALCLICLVLAAVNGLIKRNSNADTVSGQLDLSGKSYINYYEPDYETDIMTDEDYLAQNRTVKYVIPSDTGSVSIVLDEYDRNELTEGQRFFMSYFDTVISGDYEKYHEMFTDEYISSPDGFETKPADRVFPMQRLYDITVTELGRTDPTDTQYSYNGMPAVFGVYEVSYKILKNDGEFRHDIPSGGEVPLIFEIVTTGAGTADELTLIKDVYKYTDISGE